MTDKPTTILFLGTTCVLSPDDGFGTVYSGRPSLNTDIIVQVEPNDYSAEVKQSGAHSRWHAQGRGATLEECEKNLRADIFRTERSFESLCRPLEPSNPLIQACDDFLTRWQQIPPLVRASYGYNIVKHTLRESHQIRSEERDFAKHMPRRSRVNAAFDQASDALRMLAIALTNAADNEAVAAGIDADVGTNSTSAVAGAAGAELRAFLLRFGESAPEKPGFVLYEKNLLDDALRAFDGAEKDVRVQIGKPAIGELIDALHGKSVL